MNTMANPTADSTRRSTSHGPPKKRKLTPEKAKEIRLAQNRKAARESRKRKKAMIEELQRSLVFFSKANNTLKQQNEDLTRRLMDAKAHVEQYEAEGGNSQPTAAVAAPPSEPLEVKKENAVVTPQPVTSNDEKKDPGQVDSSDISNNSKESKKINKNTLKLLSTINASPAPASVALQRTLPLMQPGATMEEMAKFQQATAAAMQAAAQGIGAFHASSIHKK